MKMNECTIVGKALRLVCRDAKFLKIMNEQMEKCSSPKYDNEKEWKKYIKACENYLLELKEIVKEL